MGSAREIQGTLGAPWAYLNGSDLNIIVFLGHRGKTLVQLHELRNEHFSHDQMIDCHRNKKLVQIICICIQNNRMVTYKITRRIASTRSEPLLPCPFNPPLVRGTRNHYNTIVYGCSA
jgi:hypothetical protein